MTVEELINLVKPENPYTFGYTPKKNPYITKGEITYIGLSQNKYTIIDTEDLPKVENYRWYSQKNSRNMNASYAASSNPDRRLHRLLRPECKILDHINRNSLDNRKENLRNASCSLNNLNAGVRSSSGYLGVHKSRRKWAVKIVVKSKYFYFGMFSTPEEANVVAKKERERIIKELEQELAGNPPTSHSPPITP